MEELPQISFRDYLRQRRRGKISPEPVYDGFLEKVACFFDLRAASEEWFHDHPWVAKSKQRALPLPWERISEIMIPPEDTPRETLISQIAKRCLVDVENLLHNMRKVLSRVQQKIPIGQVQQLDAHCLRWLTRQPGRTKLEKAGNRQEILGVVRVENYDTLENRVLKDFLARCLPLADKYLNDYYNVLVKNLASRYPEYRDSDYVADHLPLSVHTVARFRNLCVGGLKFPVMEMIRPLSELPTPNYVLQQDRRYSQIWKMYCRILRQEVVAEKLWNSRQALEEIYSILDDTTVPKAPTGNFVGGTGLHCNSTAKYQAPIWFNDIDGSKPLVENPWWRNELVGVEVRPTELQHEEMGIVDLTGGTTDFPVLVYGLNHENEKPYLQDFNKPNPEPVRAVYSLEQILSLAEKDELLEAGNLLRDYFEQLQAKMQSREWIILVPDNWSPAWLETVIGVAPFPRDKVFLLWRSVAAILGVRDQLENVQDGMRVRVFDGQFNGAVVTSMLTLSVEEGRVIPRRLAWRRHRGELYWYDAARRFVTTPDPVKKPLPQMASPDTIAAVLGHAPGVPLVVANEHMFSSIRMRAALGRINIGRAVLNRSDLKLGARRFAEDRAKGIVSYYDELEALSLVVQTRKETVEVSPLVKHDENFPGGSEYVGKPNKKHVLKFGSVGINLYLYEGEPTSRDVLSRHRVKFDVQTKEDERLVIRTRMTPGQGLAIVHVDFESGNLEKPVRVDLKDLKAIPWGARDDFGRLIPRTIGEIERAMPRSFPPEMPFVSASASMWNEVDWCGQFFLKDKYSWDGKEFAKARNVYTEKTLPADASPIDLFRRVNVFGNEKGHELPVPGFAYKELFEKLADRYMYYRKNKTRFKEKLSIITRVIAWTYQSEEPCFAPIRSILIKQYQNGRGDPQMPLEKQEYTLLANMASDVDDQFALLETAAGRIEMKAEYNDDYSCNDDIRLIYNLLQFYPGLMDYCSTERAETLMHCLEVLYTRESLTFHKVKTFTTASTILKAMLFLLHRRRCDHGFYRQWTDERLPEWISEPIPSATVDRTRKTFINYVSGKGSIGDLPTD